MKAVKWLDRHIEEIMLTFLTALLLTVLFLQVLFRFAIKLPLGWTEELAINMLPWLCYFGSSLAVRERKHMRIEIITHFLPKKLQKVFDLISDFCFLAFSIFVLYYSTILTQNIILKNAKTAVLAWPKWVMYIGIPIAFALTCYRLAEDIIRCFKELKEIDAGGKIGEMNKSKEDL